MTDKSWKHAERRAAKTFNSKRTGPIGFNVSDVTHPLLSISVKYRKTAPKWATDCLTEARSFRDAAGKLPALIILGRYMRISDGLVVMRVKDFQELFGKLDHAEEEGVESETSTAT